MLIILVSCFSLAALGLLGTAVWMYFNQKKKTDVGSKPNSQFALLITAGLGIFACFLAVILFVIYIWGFMNFSS